MYDSPAPAIASYPLAPPWPTWPQAWVTPPSRSGRGWRRGAVISVLLGLPGLLVGVLFLPQVLAITIGAMAYTRIPAGQRGRGWAVAGIVIGCLEVALWLLILVAIAVAMPGPGPGSAIMG